VPSHAKGQETDIFIVCEYGPERRRFALHVECKRGNGKFELDQAEAYRPRGNFMMNKPEFMSYSDFATVLIAPLAFLNAHATEAASFDTAISFEALGGFIPDFKSAN
jgi:hypothetical protein